MPRPSFDDGKETISFSFEYTKDVIGFVISIFGGVTTGFLLHIDSTLKIFFNEVAYV
jgi:hypothetical protein